MKIGLRVFRRIRLLICRISISNASCAVISCTNEAVSTWLVKIKKVKRQMSNGIFSRLLHPQLRYPGMWKSPTVNISSVNSVYSGDGLFWSA